MALAGAADDEVAEQADAGASPPPQRVHYFGDYELLEEIGHGGMGKVWKARQVSLHRTVALKMIHAGRFAGPDEVARFRREAGAASCLDHPNIVPIYEVGEHEGQHYFTMKFIEGGTLADKLAEENRGKGAEGKTDAGRPRPSTPLPVFPFCFETTARLLAQIARAVHHAHQRGIMHRDLKPANILLDTQGEPHLTDFGLAKFVTPPASAATTDIPGRPGAAAPPALTRTGSILGSINYMAPEQAGGNPRELTTAVDLYALGCILYELLTGHTPHQADTPIEMLRKFSTDEIKSPRALNRSIDRDLETICLKCLERDPERRYSSAAALAEDFEHWLKHEPVVARPVGPAAWMIKWIKRHPLKLALGLMTLLAMAGPLVVIAWYVVRELPYRATVHQIQDDDLHGVFKLEIYEAKGERCTLNFTRRPFSRDQGKKMRLAFINVPPEWKNRLAVKIFADQAGRLDPERSPLLTNGQSFVLKVGSFFDRAFYCAEVGWAASNLLSVAPEARIRLEPDEEDSTPPPPKEGR
jgi:serine/threonine protein kinase